MTYGDRNHFSVVARAASRQTSLCTVHIIPRSAGLDWTLQADQRSFDMRSFEADVRCLLLRAELLDGCRAIKLHAYNDKRSSIAMKVVNPYRRLVVCIYATSIGN